jgi:maltooligosyltrehalose trehalohydrolase
VEEYHIDGFRLDATDQIVDDSPAHILSEIARHARAATRRNVVVIAEDARHDVRLVQQGSRGGYRLDALWADDFHHELRVFLANAHENYFAHYAGSMEEIARAVTEGFIFHGLPSPSTRRASGTDIIDAAATSFVFCIQNHDQIGNRPFGERIHHEINLDRYAVASALLLCLPQAIVLFMGQEFAASTPFLFFTDHNEELGKLVTAGRRREFRGFRAFADDDMQQSIPDPQAEETFLASRLRLEERETQRGIYDLYRTLLGLRQDDPVLSRQDRARTTAEALGAEAVVIHRWNGGAHRVLIANFGPARQIAFDEVAGLRENPSARWRVALSTTRRRFGGSGRPVRIQHQEVAPVIEMPARSAVLLAVVVD